MSEQVGEQGKAFTKEGPGASVKDGVLSDPDLLWVEDDWTEERVTEAKAVLEKQSKNGQAPNAFWVSKYQNTAGKFWHDFYKRNKQNFYKDRHYLHIVFPELMPIEVDSSTHSKDLPRKLLLEVGCGVGNAVLPLAEMDSLLDVVCIDFAKSAVELLQGEIAKRTAEGEHSTSLATEEVAVTAPVVAPGGDGTNSSSAAPLRGTVVASVCDVTKDDLPVAENSVDLILCMYVMSAIGPESMKTAFTKLYKALKPGGKLLFRDYGRYDEAQLRFTNKSRLGENFYVRQDGTCVYYFEDSELRTLLCGAEGVQTRAKVEASGCDTQVEAAVTTAETTQTEVPNSVFTSLQSPIIRTEDDCKGIGFECEECYYIKRQYANRAQKAARYRVWVHGKFRKPLL